MEELDVIITHIYGMCLNCGYTLEIYDDDYEEKELKCYKCGYINDPNDENMNTWEE